MANEDGQQATGGGSGTAGGEYTASLFFFPFSFSSSPSSNPPRRRGRCPPQWVRHGLKWWGMRLGGIGHGRRARRG